MECVQHTFIFMECVQESLIDPPVSWAVVATGQQVKSCFYDKLEIRRVKPSSSGMQLDPPTDSCESLHSEPHCLMSTATSQISHTDELTLLVQLQALKDLQTDFCTDIKWNALKILRFHYRKNHIYQQLDLEHNNRLQLTRAGEGECHFFHL